MNCSAALCRCIEEKLFSDSEFIQGVGDPRVPAIYDCLHTLYVDFHGAYKLNKEREILRQEREELRRLELEFEHLRAWADRDSNQSTPSDGEPPD
eukprot:14869741-Heterocapsa_arctica.AAC.1